MQDNMMIPTVLMTISALELQLIILLRNETGEKTIEAGYYFLLTGCQSFSSTYFLNQRISSTNAVRCKRGSSIP